MSSSSLIDLKSLTPEALSSILSLSLKIFQNFKNISNQNRGTSALLFFEPSTRTRLSFELGCVQEGFYPSIFDGETGSSLEKGESIEDTILNVAAMRPDFLVIRCGDSVDLKTISQRVKIPILNAGWGRLGHPSQALLDVATMMERWGTIEDKKIFFVGDIRHSRVVASHFELAKKLGYRVAIGGPLELLPDATLENVQRFSSLEEGLEWGDAIMGLRVQKERHQSSSRFLEYESLWKVDLAKLNKLSPNGLVLHPGPVNWGVEFDSDVMGDSRTIILEQVTMGVCVRRAMIRWMLEGKS